MKLFETHSFNDFNKNLIVFSDLEGRRGCYVCSTIAHSNSMLRGYSCKQAISPLVSRFRALLKRGNFSGGKTGWKTQFLEDIFLTDLNPHTSCEYIVKWKTTQSFMFITLSVSSYNPKKLVNIYCQFTKKIWQVPFRADHSKHFVPLFKISQAIKVHSISLKTADIFYILMSNKKCDKT